MDADRWETLEASARRDDNQFSHPGGGFICVKQSRRG